MRRPAAPTRDIDFALRLVVRITKSNIAGSDAPDANATDAIVAKTGRFSAEVDTPLNPVGAGEGGR